ncbi:phage tail protein [Halobacillus naozhouensis]|uniref:Phage-related protein n=1 Tax=Halobacillus naozhouensis TaxID=554880 RepID=A0ABY8IXG3_9BACI|nr:hypothetical protein [Halobacillus naozhouensis]WFT74895.1 hypothetical protein P9989_00195 [Halobacillus naozhouensis]
MAIKQTVMYKVGITDRMTKPLRRMQGQLESFKRTSEKLDNMQITPKIDAKTKKAEEDLDKVKRKTDSLPRRIVTHIELSNKDFLNRMDRIAQSMRTFEELSSGIAKGGMFMALPALVPILGVAAGGIGAIGSAFTSAGIGAAGFATVAIPAISGVIQANKNLKAAQQAVENASNPEERAAAVKKLTKLQNGLTESQRYSIKALRDFTSFFSQFTKQFEPDVLHIFNNALKATKTVLELSKPAIESTVDAVDRLMDSFNKSLKTEDVKSFFDWLGKTAGPNLEKLTKGVGNFIQGIFNMAVAFDPLAKSFGDGFLDMSEKFRKWTKTLSENKAFQKFMKFVSENTPTVMSLIGNITKFLVNLGIAMAPLGEQVLNLANKFFAWASELLKNEKWLGIIAGLIPIIYGAFRILTPLISGAISAFKFLWPIVQKAWKWFGKLKGSFTKILPTILRVGSFITRLSGPIGIIISIVILLATKIISNWDTIWAKTKEIFGKVKSFLINTWHEIRLKFAMVKAIAKMVRDKFNEMKNSIKEKMEAAWKKIEEIWGKAESFLENINLFRIGGNIIEGLIDGIQSINLGSVISGLAEKIPDWIAKPLGIRSPSRVTMKLGGFIGEGLVIGMQRMKSPAERAAQGVVDAVQRPFSRMNTEFAFGVSGRSYGNLRRNSGGSQTQAAEAGDTNVYNQGLLDGAVFNVREEADIKKIATELGKEIKGTKRQKGVR